MDRLGLGKETEVNKNANTPTIRLTVHLDPNAQHEISYPQLIKEFFASHPEVAAYYKKEKSEKSEKSDSLVVGDQSEPKEKLLVEQDDDPLSDYTIRNRFTDVISRIERKYALQTASDNEGSDSDDYDRKDKFIDDTEVVIRFIAVKN
jgi:hypothetical protein